MVITINCAEYETCVPRYASTYSVNLLGSAEVFVPP